ncbi:RagB/SusD family nutrient uptake outer membrane protein [Wenyingzhuangia sp. 1_MG-2023]|nr:RagB/SusD family nutrient uptake outer membrane protein [Wenyingzhuangia sp. 1_MG-2023]
MKIYIQITDRLITFFKTQKLISTKMVSLFCLVITFSCQDDFVDIDTPPQLAAGDVIFESITTANTALSGIYTLMKSSESFVDDNFFGTSIFLGLYSDELRLDNEAFGTPVINQSKNALNPESDVVVNTWSESYNIIQASNRAIEGLMSSSIPDSDARNQLLGEAYFCRAYTHFHLVKLYGDVPYLKSSNFEENALASRTPIADIYDNIIEDLLLAKNLMQNNYNDSNRVRPNKGTASALLARAYIFMEEWVNAEIESSLVINNPLYVWESNLNNVFLSNSTGTIWQFDETVANRNTPHGVAFNLSPFLVTNSLSLETVAAFEPGDSRRSTWTVDILDFATFTTKTNLFKYKSGSVQDATIERYKLFRLAEQYLIRAEARAQLNNISGSQDDLNLVRSRASLGETPARTRKALLTAIMQERRIELLGESGQRWFDLVRTGQADDVMSAIPSHTDWEATDVLYPLPQSDLLLNPNLEPQNPGY